MIYTLWHDVLQEWFVFDKRGIEIDRVRDCGNVKILFQRMRKDKLNIVPLEPLTASYSAVPRWWAHSVQSGINGHDTNIGNMLFEEEPSPPETGLNGGFVPRGTNE
jgi:hypothetical protein